MPDSKVRFKFDYFESLSKHIVKKQYVTGEMLAEALRKKESLPFPETFLDYLCRFLKNEIKRGRGRPKAPNFKEPHSGNTCHCHLEHVTKRIESGDYVSGSELADVLRSEAAGEIPDRMLEYLCQFLTVSVKKPRGRPPMPPSYKRRHDMIINGLYRRYTDRLVKRQAREGRPAGWTDLPYPPAEMAARIVARNCYYGEGSWRSVQTLASKYKKTQLF